MSFRYDLVKAWYAEMRRKWAVLGCPEEDIHETRLKEALQDDLQNLANILEGRPSSACKYEIWQRVSNVDAARQHILACQCAYCGEACNGARLEIEPTTRGGRERWEILNRTKKRR